MKTDRPAPTEIEITREMIEAGASELRSRHIGDSPEDIVYEVFLMMALESAVFARAT